VSQSAALHERRAHPGAAVRSDPLLAGECRHPATAPWLECSSFPDRFGPRKPSEAAGSAKDSKSGREVAGALVRPVRVKAILQAIGIPDRQWRRYVEQWEKLGVAHQCAVGSVFLFTQPEFMNCAACRHRLEFSNASPDAGRRWNEHDARGRFTAKPVAVVRPNSGPGTATGADPTRPPIEREGSHQSDRSLQGLEVGVPLTPEEGEAFLLAETVLKPSSEKSARSLESEEETG